MTAAGDLSFKLKFQNRRKIEGAYGAKEEEWTTQFTRRADIRPLRGSEPVIAQRLQGVQPVLIIVRFDSETVCIDPSWRAVQVINGKDAVNYAIKSAQDMDMRREEITIVAEKGAADGGK